MQPRNQSIVWIVAFLTLVSLTPALQSMLGIRLAGGLIGEARADTISYAYDALGRVIQATDSTSGQAIFYEYDSVGNITSQQVVPLTTLAISGFSMDQGATGTQVTIDGTGFSTTDTADTVEFNGTAATVVQATQTQLVVSIPAGATTGSISVQTGGSTATSQVPFSVTTATAPPTIASFSPAGGAAGTAVTITGTNFLPTLAANKVQINGVDAPISAATPTTLTVVVPDDVGSGVIEVITPYGSATGNSDFMVPPPGYPLSSIASTRQTSENGGTVDVSVGANQIAMVLFNGNQGDQYVGAAIQGSGTGATIEVVDPHGNVIASGCGPNCLYDLPTLTSTGTYAAVIAHPESTFTFPVTITKGATGLLNLSWSDEGQDLWESVAQGSVTQQDVLSFSGTAGQLTEVQFRSIVNSWTLSLLNASGTTLWSAALNSTTTSVSIPALPSNGSYSLVFNPQFTGGSIQYNAGIIGPSALSIGGSAVTVYGGGPNPAFSGPVAEATFSGTVGQNLMLTVGATQGFFSGLNVYQVTSSGQTCLGQCGTGYIGGTCNVALPVLPATGTYIVYIQFNSNVYSAAQISVATGTGATNCILEASLGLKRMLVGVDGVDSLEASRVDVFLPLQRKEGD